MFNICKNKYINIWSIICLLLSIIAFLIMILWNKKIGSNILIGSLILSLISALVVYYGIGENSFMGRSKKQSQEEVLKKQSEGFKLAIPIIFIAFINIIFISIYYIFY